MVDERETLLIAMKVNGNLLQFASRLSKDDKEIVMVAVKSNGYALKYASKRLKQDYEIACEAIKNNPNSYQYVSEELKNDPLFIPYAAKYIGISFVKDCVDDAIKIMF